MQQRSHDALVELPDVDNPVEEKSDVEKEEVNLDSDHVFVNEISDIHMSRYGGGTRQFSLTEVVVVQLGKKEVSTESKEADVAYGEAYSLPEWTINEMRQGWRKLVVWQNLFAKVLVSGPTRFSAGNYVVLRKCLKYQLEKLKTEDKLLPDCSTVYRTFPPHLREWGSLKSVRCQALLDISKVDSCQTLQSLQQVEKILDTFKSFHVLHGRYWKLHADGHGIC